MFINVIYLGQYEPPMHKTVIDINNFKSLDYTKSLLK